LAAEKGHELVPHDARNLLRGRELLQNLGPQGPLLDSGGELLDHRQSHVRFQQGKADLPQGGLQVVLGQVPLAAELLKNALDPVAEAFEHPAPFQRRPRQGGASRKDSRPAGRRRGGSAS
jgi:hypothetical protein